MPVEESLCIDAIISPYQTSISFGNLLKHLALIYIHCNSILILTTSVTSSPVHFFQMDRSPSFLHPIPLLEHIFPVTSKPTVLVV